jgi:bifunctional UDP-N-acetylglucosamine pyrophosphorylase/glucosamine-1-phosphate N-acetyltransferase
MQAVILAAGKGLRLRPFTENHPKPLIPIAGKPLIEYTLESLPDNTTEIIIVVGYLGDQIISHLGDSWHGKPIRYVNQEVLLGTGDAILQAKSVVDRNFLVVNGDDLYTKSDLTKLLDYPLSILAWPSTKPSARGLLQDDSGQLQGFSEDSTLVNCGAYHLTKEFFQNQLVAITVHDKTEYSLPHTLVEMAEDNKVMVVQAKHWLPVGTPEQLKFANDYYIKKLQN